VRGITAIMTPNETAIMIHRELSPIAPKLSAALNRALLDIGEGSRLVGLGSGTHQSDPATFHEFETFSLKGSHPADILTKITQVLQALEAHSSWKVIIDKKPSHTPDQLELLYTLFRDPHSIS